MKSVFLFIYFVLRRATATMKTVLDAFRGIARGPEQRPVPAIQVVLKAKASDFALTTQTDANGEFHFDAVPLGQYTVTVSDASFAAEEQIVTVLSGTAPILHFELHVASQSQSVTVTSNVASVQ